MAKERLTVTEKKLKEALDKVYALEGKVSTLRSELENQDVLTVKIAQFEREINIMAHIVGINPEQPDQFYPSSRVKVRISVAVIERIKEILARNESETLRANINRDIANEWKETLYRILEINDKKGEVNSEKIKDLFGDRSSTGRPNQGL